MTLLGCALWVLLLYGFPQDTPPPVGAGKSGERPGLEADERGFVKIGPHRSVRLHPRKKIVEADGTFNLRYGFIEYLACAPGIKPHETLVALECNPMDLKFALILLGLDDTRARAPATDTDLRAIEGDRMVILLRWTTKDENGKEQTHELRAEDCILNTIVEEEMQKVGWVFTGSSFIQKPPDIPPRDGDPRRLGGKGTGKLPQPEMVFAPLLTGEFISVCHRPWVLIDNPVAIPFPDAAYHANPLVLPPVDRDEPVLVTMVFRRDKPGEIDRSVVRMKVPPPETDDDDAGATKKDDDGKAAEKKAKKVDDKDGGKPSTLEDHRDPGQDRS